MRAHSKLMRKYIFFINFLEYRTACPKDVCTFRQDLAKKAIFIKGFHGGSCSLFLPFVCP